MAVLKVETEIIACIKASPTFYHPIASNEHTNHYTTNVLINKIYKRM